MSFRQTVGCVLLLPLVMMCLSASAVAQTSSPAVHFCFTDWPPYTRIEGAKPTGISVDILREAARRAQLTPTFSKLPWKRCLAMVRVGQMDAVIDSGKRPEFLQGPTSFSTLTHTFWVREDDPATVFDPSFLTDRSVGLVHGYLYPDSLLTLLASRGQLVDFAKDDATNARKVAFGRLETMVGDLMTIGALAHEHGLRIRPLRPNYGFHLLYPSFNQDRADLHTPIDSALAAMLKDGTIDRVYRKHLGKGRAELGLTDTLAVNP